jgi:hypothetical protein
MSGGWTVVDYNSNKSLPITGIASSGTVAPFVTPALGSQDPVGKFRVSTPQALIDTDFEYGTQPTKWETIALQNNRQSVYFIPQQPLGVTSITGTTTLTLTGSFTVAANTSIFIQNATDPYANGWWYTIAGGTNTMTIIPTTACAAGEKFSNTSTYVYAGYFYSNCGIQLDAGSSAFAISGSTVTVTTTNPHGLNKGSYVYVTNVGGYTTNQINGAQVVDTVPSANTFTYINTAGTPSTLPTFVTANITASNTTGSFTVATTPLVGLRINTVIVVTGTQSGTNTPFVAGTYLVSATNGTTTFTLTTLAGGVVTTVATGTNTGLTFTPQATGNAAGQTNLFARPSGYTEPRSFDGGVAFTAGGGTPNQQLIRQTRRYFRYQSGKGLQFSTGSSLKPALFVTSLTGSTTTATVTTRYAHNLTAGAKIQVLNADQGAYNGNFTVASVTSPTIFTYTTAQSVGAATTATGLIRISPTSWYGSSNRVGMFDQQNGVFFEFDGQTLYAVLRNSINQINGTVAVTNGSATVTGTGTSFATQLLVGDYIVIRGQSYKVITIVSNTDLRISPEYRGSTISGALVSKTIDFRVPQSLWYDKCDGTGASGYNIDLTRMQMFYIDYSWYGAGTVRYGFRATNGQVTYVTQIQHNNRQFEAYMRSGNMAAHYESNGQSAVTYLTSSLAASGSTTTTAAIAVDALSIPLTATTGFNNAGVVLIGSEYVSYSGISGTTLVGCVRGYGGTTARGYASGTTVTASSMDIADGAGFAPSGSVKVQASGVSGAIEYIAYAGNDGSFLYGLTRAQTGGAAAATSFTYSATAPVAVEFASPDTVPSLSHWGSSVIMDGQFNDDKSLIFNYGTTSQLAVPAGATVPIIAIRIAPSVDNGQIGLLGVKEIINRMQLQLVELGIVSAGTFLINLVLNGYCTSFSGSWSSPTVANGYTSSLAQVAVNTTTSATISGGESVAAAFTNSSGQTTLDLSGVRDLGNSILGGGTTFAVPTGQAGQYPVGPDILYVAATNTAGTSTNILVRLSWKEAQA